MVGDDRDFRPLLGRGGLYIILGGENAWHRAWLIISSNPSGPLLQRALLNPVKYIWSESFPSTAQWTNLHIAIAPHPLLGENQLWCSLLAEGQLNMWQ